MIREADGDGDGQIVSLLSVVQRYCGLISSVRTGLQRVCQDDDAEVECNRVIGSVALVVLHSKWPMYVMNKIL